MDIDVNDLVRRSKDGQIASRELAQVVATLQSGDRTGETYQLLYVIARAGDVSNERLVATFLDYSADPTVAKLALQTLCRFWGLEDKYSGEIVRFLRGVAWDELGDVRLVAATAAGEFLSSRRHCAMLEALLRLATTDTGDPVDRRVALEALARAIGIPLQTAMTSGSDPIKSEAWANAILDRAERRHAAECDEEYTSGP